jgi:hypothetical protein
VCLAAGRGETESVHGVTSFHQRVLQSRPPKLHLNRITWFLHAYTDAVMPLPAMAALPVPRCAGQASEGAWPGDGPGARKPAEHHVPGGEQHPRRPRPRHGEAEADEPPPPRRHIAAHRRHGRPLRRLLRPRRVSRRRRVERVALHQQLASGALYTRVTGRRPATINE